MEFSVISQCVSCNERKLCNEVITEYEDKKIVMNFCEECDNEIQDILNWANEYNLKNNKKKEGAYEVKNDESKFIINSEDKKEYEIIENR